MPYQPNFIECVSKDVSKMRRKCDTTINKGSVRDPRKTEIEILLYKQT